MLAIVRSTLIVLVLGLVVGTVMAFLAVFFVDGVVWLNSKLFIEPRSRMLASDAFWLPWVTIIVPTAGGLIVGILCLGIAERRAHNPADAIYAAQSLDSYMSVKSGAITGVSSFLALGTGCSVGQYGALAHLGASVGSWISRIFHGSKSYGTIGIGCGVAAAISAAFNAPIAGLIFAHEVILRHYSLRAFAPITVAAALGYVVSSVIFERPPIIHVESLFVEESYEFALFALIGVLGAFISVAFMRILLFINSYSAKSFLPLPIRTMLAGLAVGLIALELPEVLGIGREVLRFAIIEEAFTFGELGQIFIAKLMLTALCLGVGVAGGVFSPSLLIGILFGAMFGLGIEFFAEDIRSHIAIYAICGMVAVASPVIGAPLTSILIVFELTHNYELATAAMVSVVFANLVTLRIFGRSLFDKQLEHRGYDLSMGRDKVVMEQRKVADFVSDDYTRVLAKDSLQHVYEVLCRDQRTEAYVVNSSGYYLGTIGLVDLGKHSLKGKSMNVDVESYAKPESIIFNTDTSIWQAMEGVGNFQGESIPVVERGILKGVVTEAMVVEAYMNCVEEIRREENAT